ncbi:putative carbon monoxide dehydrogenase subunit G [Phaeobacter piscinae]|uniref:Carbon monoxide dehydrogenase subunit G n=1 Tax=Phaeobacter piscinae TaxID=1580596 RepID=A0ABM6PF56_9RHOB|nr:carbon monoxide dehydrogenase subunit G [Phaeobacter piscinae]ATG36241.1 putative carbon monoxide dehydrogenase subunit G [Phaeobacter piscinae]AUQ86762.1 putative carbon monoxide dehydrogenase subunit G [Phaeobacter piscinae]AUR24645.1 putative carbon monoxide dehydrogenase subunit G [Phaeobacter piscinae]
MKLADTRTIAAPRAEVWQGLLDAETLKNAVPGCQEMDGSAENGFTAVVVQKVGPVKATFRGTVTLSDLDAPNSLTLRGEGKGGAAGFAKGDAHVTLSDGEDGQTLLSYEVEAKVGGKLAQLGSRIIDGFAKKMADQFFERFQSAVEADEAAGGDAEEGDADTENPTDDDAPRKGWIGRVLGS